MGPICCPETSVKDYHSTLPNTSEERRSQQHRGGSLKSRIAYFASHFTANHSLNVFPFILIRCLMTTARRNVLVFHRTIPQYFTIVFTFSLAYATSILVSKHLSSEFLFPASDSTASYNDSLLATSATFTPHSKPPFLPLYDKCLS
jgi:hypothetical protein